MEMSYSMKTAFEFVRIRVYFHCVQVSKSLIKLKLFYIIFLFPKILPFLNQMLPLVCLGLEKVLGLF